MQLLLVHFQFPRTERTDAIGRSKGQRLIELSVSRAIPFPLLFRSVSCFISPLAVFGSDQFFFFLTARSTTVSDNCL